jgi:hypothetical protein
VGMWPVVRLPRWAGVALEIRWEERLVRRRRGRETVLDVVVLLLGLRLMLVRLS